MAHTNRVRPDTSTPAAPGDTANTAQRIKAALVSLGPFSAALVAYKAVLDYVLPEDWFSVAVLRYLFAGLCALCIGLALRLAGQRYAGEASAPAPAPPPPGSAAPSVRRVVDDSAHGVLAEFREVRHRGADLAGWSQYLNDHHVPPTAVGSSYGLRMITAFDIRDPRISRRRVIDSLLALQKPGGGWAASTQRDRGRPEITAWVLAAMFRGGLDNGTKAELVNLLERMLDPQEDPVGMNRTTVLTVAISTLAEVAPASPKLPWLARRLLDGAQREDDEAAPVAHWGENLHSAAKSAAHTARAALALHRAAGVLADGAVYRNAARSGVRWLCAADLDVRTTDEQLRRPVDDGTVDALLIGHFTAAWVARALMLPGTPGCEEKLRGAVADILKNYKDGAWRWHDDTRPIWMTYQGTSTLRDFALRTTACP
ncbi:hypothetical protein [Streptomyces sp. 6-11-2]|uniref:hypothetical protein n=1 Tax=Streptomyces sp. 6-11-2 TaxID=2585753 RepID=UPI0011447D73|nr:hypothetical protein [Streptomyces sp. 6-11-2]GED90204.1 transcriptional regulator [Streptomyces sp. 6-11-2]